MIRIMKLITVSLVLALTLLTAASCADSPDQKAELRIALSDLSTETFDPLEVPGPAKMYLEPIFDWLVGCTPEGELSPGLALEWEQSSDGMSWVFQLREGVKFHNGEELTAADVKFSLDRITEERKSGFAATLAKTIEKVEVIDPYTVRVVTTAPSISLPANLSPVQGVEGIIVPKLYMEEKGESYFAANPVGTGPYQFLRQEIGSYMLYEAAGEHWQVGSPQWDQMRLMLVPESTTRVTMLERGEADVIEATLAQVSDIEAKGYDVVSKPTAAQVLGYLNQQWEPDSVWNDARVREAMNIAIDRETIIRTILAGFGEPTANVFSSEPTIGYQAMPLYEYNPERAERLLEEAGYPDGFEFTLYSSERVGVPIPLITEAVAGYYEAIGLKPRIVSADWATYRSKWASEDAANSASLSPAAAAWPFLDPIAGALFKSDGPLPLVHTGGQPELDAICERIVGAVTTEAYEEAVGDLIWYLRDGHHLLALFNVDSPYPVAGTVEEWELGPVAYSLDLRWIR